MNLEELKRAKQKVSDSLKERSSLLTVNKNRKLYGFELLGEIDTNAPLNPEGYSKILT